MLLAHFVEQVRTKPALPNEAVPDCGIHGPPFFIALSFCGAGSTLYLGIQLFLGGNHGRAKTANNERPAGSY